MQKIIASNFFNLIFIYLCFFFSQNKIHANALNMNQSDACITKLEAEVQSLKTQLEKARESIIPQESDIPNGCLYRFMLDCKTNHTSMVHVSPAFKIVTGIDAEIIMNDHWAIADVIHPEDRDHFIQENEKAIKALSYLFCEFRVFVDNQWRWLQLTSYPHSDGENVMWEGIILDVTARKNAQIELAKNNIQLEFLVKERTGELEAANEELRSSNEKLQIYQTKLELMVEEKTSQITHQQILFEAVSSNIPDGTLYLFEVDIHTGKLRFTYVSSTWEKITGVSAEKSIADAYSVLSRVENPDDLKRLTDVSQLFEKNASGKKRFDYEVRYNHPHVDGDYWIKISSNAHVEGDTIFSYGYILDITARKLAEKESIEYEIKLEKLSGSKSALIKALQILQSSEDMRQALYEAIAEIGKFTNVCRIHIFETTSDGKTVNLTMEWRNDGVESVFNTLQNIPANIALPWFEMFEAGKHVSTSDNSQLTPELSKMLTERGVKSVVVFPLSEGAENYGFIFFDDLVGNRVWNEIEVDLLRNLSNILTAAIHRFHAETALQQHLPAAMGSAVKAAAYLEIRTHFGQAGNGTWVA